MRLFFKYLKERRAMIVAFLLFIAIFSVSFVLYRLPIEAVGYPAVLCAVLGAGLIALDFVRVARRHRVFRKMSELSADMLSDLPDPETIEGEDYQEMITKLRSEIQALEEQSSMRYRDMTDYYTVWVHQIKTPIASMRLTLQNEDTPTSRKLSSDLFRIEQYVEMVLAFLRLDSPSSDYVFKEYSVDSIIRQAIKKFAGEFIDRRITLEYEPSGEQVITDEKWFLFVIEQLLSNALKYTREGSIRIFMSEPKILCIKDSGIGIAPEDLPRVFEKGYTGCNGRTDKKASGLGLYLCKRICQNLGAGIRIASEPDRGTAVYIDLSQYDLKVE